MYFLLFKSNDPPSRDGKRGAGSRDVAESSRALNVELLPVDCNQSCPQGLAVPTGCCPMPSVPIPHTETRKNPAAASPFHLPPCLMASGLGSSYVTNWEPLSHHSSQNLLCEHPPSLQSVFPLLSCTMACVTTGHCTMGPAVPQLALAPRQPSPHGSSCPRPTLRISAGLAPCLIFLCHARDGI